MSILSAQDRLATLRDNLTAITQETDRITTARKQVFLDERNFWRQSGRRAYVLTNDEQHPAERRHIVRIREHYSDFFGRYTKWHRDVFWDTVYEDDEPDEAWGPYATHDGGVRVVLGDFVVTLADEEAIVVAQIGDGPTPAQLQRATARLRGVAARDYMKISVRDLAVTVTTPMNDAVHEGDVTSAYLWLAGCTEDRIALHEMYEAAEPRVWRKAAA